MLNSPMSDMAACPVSNEAAFGPPAAPLARVGQREPDELQLVRHLNKWLTATWRTRLLTEPTLDAERLIDRAVKLERGDPASGEWEEALLHLTRDLRHRADLNALGRTIAHGLLVQILRQRIKAQRLWRRHPQILDVAVERPIILLGHMRSGTTRLHRLLSCDPRFAYTRMYETMQPVRTSRVTAHARAAMIGRFMELCNPRLAQIHPARSGAPEEEYGLHAFSLHGAMFEAQWAVPQFARWSEQRGLATVYAEFHRLVQTLRWYRRESPARIQILKAPQFMQDAEALLRTFPDARIIRLVRDRAAVVASSASLVWNQRRIQSDACDPVEIGTEWKLKTELREQRAAAALSGFNSSAILTVEFDATNRDWRREVRRIYEFLDLPLDDRVIARMAGVMSDTRHVGHRYAQADFGLDP